MIFVIGMVLLVICFIYANFFMKSSGNNWTWTDAFFGLLMFVGFGCIITSLAIVAWRLLP